MFKKLLLCILVAVATAASASQSDRKVVVCWGDSLTAPHRGCYPEVLQELLGTGYDIVNCGVGGENAVTIMARQGAYPMELAHDIQVFNDEKAKYRKFIGNTDIPAFVSSYDGSTVTPLIQGGWKEGSAAHVNPCVMDGKTFDIASEAHFWVEDGYKFEYNYFLEKRDSVAGTFILKKGTKVETAASRGLRGAYANVYFMGQNGGFKDPGDLVRMYKAMIEYSGTSRYVIVSYHKPNGVTPTVESMKEMEKVLKKAFGDHYLNLRDYLVRRGLKDAALEPTDEDKAAMKEGKVPPQLMTDGCHFTDKGYALLAGQVADRFKKLGY